MIKFNTHSPTKVFNDTEVCMSRKKYNILQIIETNVQNVVRLYLKTIRLEKERQDEFTAKTQRALSFKSNEGRKMVAL